MGMKFNFRDEILDWNGDEIPLKTDGAIQDRDVCHTLYSIHTNEPILKETEEQDEQILLAIIQKSTSMRWLRIYISNGI